MPKMATRKIGVQTPISETPVMNRLLACSPTSSQLSRTRGSPRWLTAWRDGHVEEGRRDDRQHEPSRVNRHVGLASRQLADIPQETAPTPADRVRRTTSDSCLPGHSRLKSAPRDPRHHVDIANERDTTSPATEH
jgi:hypothetical protein